MIGHDHPETGSLEFRARRWVDAGIISEEQAHDLVGFESASVEPAEARRVGLGAEVAIYLGSVVTLMGAVVVAAERWEDIAFGGRLAIAVVTALLGSVGGALLMRVDEPVARRLASFLWVVGVGGVALGIGVTADEFDASPGATALIVGASVAVVGAALWRNLDRPLQLLTAVIGVVVVGGGVVELTDMAFWVAALVAWAAAGGFGVAAGVGVVRPRTFALLVASVGAIWSAFGLVDLDERLGPALAALSAAGVVVFALLDRSTPVLVVGVVGFVSATQATLATTFTGAVSASVVAIAGLVVVAVAVARSLRRTPPGT